MNCIKRDEDCREEKLGCEGCIYDTKEIEIGNYVRTKFYGIRRVKEITLEPELDIGVAIIPEVTVYWIDEYEYFTEEDIVNHDKNLIDLIEVGDSIEFLEFNNTPYTEKDKMYEMRIISISELNEIKQEIEENKIKLISILTHEQYEQNCYRLED